MNATLTHYCLSQSPELGHIYTFTSHKAIILSFVWWKVKRRRIGAMSFSPHVINIFLLTIVQYILNFISRLLAGIA
jgi:hypothetical protein